MHSVILFGMVAQNTSLHHFISLPVEVPDSNVNMRFAVLLMPVHCAGGNLSKSLIRSNMGSRLRKPQTEFRNVTVCTCTVRSPAIGYGFCEGCMAHYQDIQMVEYFLNRLHIFVLCVYFVSTTFWRTESTKNI